MHAVRVSPDLAGWAALGVATLVAGPPLSLLLMCIALRLLGVSKHEVRKRALRFTDSWIERYGKRGLAELTSALRDRMSRDVTKPGP
jgi:hypothetical protein